MASLERLVSSMSPPQARPQVDWEGLAERTGRVLPADYRLFVETYGPGKIDDFLWVLQPGDDRPTLDFESQTAVQMGALAVLAEDGEPMPVSLAELQPWGFTENGDVLYWVMTGSPDEWTVACNESRGPDWYSYPGDVTDFIAAVFLDRLDIGIFPDDIPSSAVTFRPVPSR